MASFRGGCGEEEEEGQEAEQVRGRRRRDLGLPLPEGLGKRLLKFYVVLFNICALWPGRGRAGVHSAADLHRLSVCVFGVCSCVRRFSGKTPSGGHR
jgi:hypothetical protein